MDHSSPVAEKLCDEFIFSCLISADGLDDLASVFARDFFHLLDEPAKRFGTLHVDSAVGRVGRTYR